MDVIHQEDVAWENVRALVHESDLDSSARRVAESLEVINVHVHSCDPAIGDEIFSNACEVSEILSEVASRGYSSACVFFDEVGQVTDGVDSGAIGAGIQLLDGSLEGDPGPSGRRRLNRLP